jgi:hypothetical protein
MPVRAEILRALEDFIANEGGMKFQHLAVALGRIRWPELIASERRHDLGLDAHASALLSPDKVGKGLASSITPTLTKLKEDAEKAKKHYGDLASLIFVTPATVTKERQEPWVTEIRNKYGFELTVIEREDIITSLMLPAGVTLCRNFLGMDIAVEPTLAETIGQIKAAASEAAGNLAARIKGPMIGLRATRLDANGAETDETFTLTEIQSALRQNRRLVLEAPAGRGKTTTLIQLATQIHAGQTTFFVDLPGWIASGRGILEFVAGAPQFQGRALDATALARVQNAEQFSFLLNGWNEIAESNSERAERLLRELDTNFPRAGIIVATRTHHLTPPLPGALRLRLLPLSRRERTAYLVRRLGAKASELRTQLDAEPVLDELTRTPFILSEVVSLFEVGAPIPDTKIGVLGAVIRLQEEGEHRNALQAAPLFGRATDYLEALATEMTKRGGVSLPETDARAIAVAVATDLVQRRQITEMPQPAAVLASLSAHHALERSDYPGVAFRFGHQQFQEYYAALGIRVPLVDLKDGDAEARHHYTADYVNEPAWTEPLRMVAEALSLPPGDPETDKRNTGAGRRLVEMALDVDPVFAGELAQLSGAAVWREVGATVGKRLRAIYAGRDENFRHLALAAMVASGSDDFKDIIVPLLSDKKPQNHPYRPWEDLQVTSLGPEWRQQVQGWSEEARAQFVYDLLHRRFDGDIASLAANDPSAAVKKAAVSGLMWTRSDDAAARVLQSMDAPTFEDVARKNPDLMPPALRDKTVATLRKFMETTADQPARLRTAIDLIELGEAGLDGVVKDALAALPSGDMKNLGQHYILPALEHLRKTDPAWVSEWVAVQVAEGVLYNAEYWMTFATAIPDALVEKYLRRLESENLENARFAGMIAVIAARADAKLAARVFGKLRELRSKVDAEPQGREFEWAVIGQLDALFRALPGDAATEGILSSITGGDVLDIKVAADLIGRVARSETDPLHVTDPDLKAQLRAYLKGSLDIVLKQDDFSGAQKANLASAIAQVGKSEDMDDLRKLIAADIQRVRRGRAALKAGNRGPMSDGATTGWSMWHIAAVMQLDPLGAQQVLIDLLPEPEYVNRAASEMARDFLPKPGRALDRTFRYELMWAARAGQLPVVDDRGKRYAAALDAEIKRQLKEGQDKKPTHGPRELATALAAIDGRTCAATVLEATAIPGHYDEYARIDAAELLLTVGVALPTGLVFALLDDLLVRIQKWMQDSDKNLLKHILALCPFIDDPVAGIARMKEVLAKKRLYAYELREIVTALGESRCDAAVDLLTELAADVQTFEQCEDNFFNAFAALDTPRARELLLGFIDPDVKGISLPQRPHREDVLVARLTELAQRDPKVAARLRELCERDLPDLNRHILSRVMDWLGTPEALVASLNLLDDTRPYIPQGVRDQLEAAFVERRPYGGNPNAFTEHARASNELRTRLFKMAVGDAKRRKSAFHLLGQIEEWRLDHGRPAGEPRHPDLQSGDPWPPNEPA